MSLPCPIQDVILVVLLVAAGAWDLRTSKVPNALTYTALVAGLVLSPVPDGTSGVLRSVAGMLIGGVPFFLLYLRGGMGGGDVKLMAAIGALQGFPFIVNAILASILVGGFMALAMVIWSGQLIQALRHVGTTLAHAVAPSVAVVALETKRPLPFAAAICVGTLLVLAGQWWRLAHAAFVI